MKTDKDETVDCREQIEHEAVNYREQIEDVYEQYASKMNGDNVNEKALAYRNAIELIPQLYFKHLISATPPTFYVGGSVIFGNIIRDQAGMIYELSFGSENFLIGILNKYDPQRGTFHHYLHSAVRNKAAGALQKEQINNTRMGITVRENEIKILRKLLKYADSRVDLCFWNESDYRSFCRAIGHPEKNWEKVKAIYIMNRQLNVVSESVSTEDGETSISIFDRQKNDGKDDNPVEQEAIKTEEEGDGMIHCQLKRMDALIFPPLTEIRKKLWPDLFTIKFQEDYLDERLVLTRNFEGQRTTRSQMLNVHWGYTLMEGIRDEYGRGKYHFIADWIFLHTITDREELELKGLCSKYGSVSGARISQENSRLKACLKKFATEMEA